MIKNPCLPYNDFRPQAQARLFCFHHSGGVASMFREWQKSGVIEVCPVQLPGRENRFQEPFIRSMPSLVDELLQFIKPFLDVPFALFGHSLGGLIAFEFTHRLLKEKIKPSMLFISACPPPQSLGNGPKLHLMPDKDLVQELKNYGATSEKILNHPDILQVILPRIRADFELFENYVYPKHLPFDIALTAFGGEEDPIVSREDLYAWKNETTAEFQTTFFPGDHFYLYSFYAALLQILKRSLLSQQLLQL